VAGVWVGNDNNTRMPGITGGTIPARIWASYMKVASQNFPAAEFDYPEIQVKPVAPLESAPQEILDEHDAPEPVLPSEQQAEQNTQQQRTLEAPDAFGPPLPTQRPQRPRRPFDGVEPPSPYPPAEEPIAPAGPPLPSGD
jgi:penicillin-binding protein 1A